MADKPQALISQVALEKPVEVEVAPGASIAEVIAAADIPDAVLPHVVTMLNGVEVTDRENVWLVDGDQLAILVMPLGGGAKDILRLVAVIAVAVAAPVLAGAMGFAAGTTAFAVAQAGITLVGTMAVNALIPPAQPSLAGRSQSDPTFWFSGSSNQMRPYQRVPVPYGSIRMYGAAIASPLIFNAGAKSVYTGLFDFGLGSLSVFDAKIGDTSIHVLRGEHFVHEQVPKLFNTGRPELGYNPVPLTLMKIPTASQQLSYGYSKENDNHPARTRPDTIAARVEMAFPSGLVEFKDNGDEASRSVTFKIEIKRALETTYYTPQYIKAYGGDHIRISGGSAGTSPDEAEYPATTITLDPNNTSFKDANGNIILTPTNDRITVRVAFDRQVYGFHVDDVTEANNDLRFNPTPAAFNSLVFDRTPVNPKGYPVNNTPGMPAEGIILVDSDPATGGVRIVDLEFTAKAGVQLTGLVAKLDTATLNDAPPVSGGKPFKSQWFYAGNAFSIDMVSTTPDAGTPPQSPPSTGPTPDESEYYNATPGSETWIKYVEEPMSISGVIYWRVQDGSGVWRVNGDPRPVTLEQIYQIRGTVMKREILLDFGGIEKYEVWAAVKKEYI